MTKNKGGRPTKMTPDCISKLETAFSFGSTDMEACCYADISTETLYKYIRENEWFSDRKEVLKNNTTMKAKRIVDTALDDKDLATAHKVIDRKEGQKIDVTTQGEKITNNFIIQPVANKPNG